MRSTFLSGLLAVCCWCVMWQVSCSAEPNQGPPPQLEEMLAWLPPSSETLIVANGPFEVGKRFNDSEQYGTSIRALCQGLWLPKSLQTGMAEHKVVLAVEGSRNFRFKGGLGLMSYDGCHLLRFEEGADESLQQSLKASEAAADEMLKVLGFEVLLLKEEAEGVPWTIYITRLAPEVLLWTTDRESLETAIIRHRTAPKEGQIRAFSRDLPEWQHVDFSASVWGLRHFSREHLQTDPTTPFNADSTDSISDPQAIGFTFAIDKTQKHIRLRYLTETDEPVKLVSSLWINPPEKLTPDIKLAAPGVVDVTATVGDDTKPGIFEFVLLLFLGHGIAL
ncbi:MAG: hypothetical protein KDA66_11920 [Planctomycetaceae bacterium]|nr:hypothetical protein [Planctomycetaceae bacterium]